MLLRRHAFYNDFSPLRGERRIMTTSCFDAPYAMLLIPYATRRRFALAPLLLRYKGYIMTTMTQYVTLLNGEVCQLCRAVFAAAAR